MTVDKELAKKLVALQGEVLRGVLSKRDDGYTSEKIPLRYEALTFQFEKGCILITVNADTDELVLAVEDAAGPGVGDEASRYFKSFVGKELGWLWFAKNDRGYKDMITFSFNGPEPEFSLVSVASNIIVYRLLELE